MTTEDDFQAALDANPDDFQTRLVFADWSQDRDDPRADGYRAVGRLRKRPNAMPLGPDNPGEWQWWAIEDGDGDAPGQLPTAWFRQLSPDRVTGLVIDGACWPSELGAITRRVAEDAAALAFTKLSPERRAELLTSIDTKK